MKGIGKKVTVAFLSVVALLAASGMISLSELSTLSYDTDEILAASGRDVEIAKDMLGAAHDHSRAMLDVAVFGNSEGLKACDEALERISFRITSVYSNSSVEVKGCLDTLVDYSARLGGLVEEQREILTAAANVDMAALKPIAMLYGSANENLVEAKSAKQRKSRYSWYEEVYEPAYNNFVAQVKRYVDLSHGELAPRAELLSKNAYRSVTPILISLAVMISIVLMLYYFINIYVVKPILRVNKALSEYLSFRLPYRTKVEMIDEVKELSDNIEHLINSSKLDVKQKKDAI